MSTPPQPRPRDGESSARFRPPLPIRYRMLVSDIDGTLLTSDSVLPEVVRSAITRARRAGIIFTIATGRRFTTTEKILRDLDLVGPLPSRGDFAAVPSLAVQSPPVILQTGAVVVSPDGREVLFRDPLPTSGARLAMKLLIEAGLQPIAYEDRVVDQRLFTGPAEYDSPAAANYLGNNPHLVVRMPYERLLQEAVATQLVVVDDRARVESTLARIEIAECRTLLSYSGNLETCFLEVFHKGCSKGRAVEQVAKYLGFGLEDVVCIGDNWNDREMLEVAGCGVAVANVEAGVSPFARRLTVSNDDHAVAVVLNQMIAGEEPGLPNPLYGGELLDVRQA